METDMRLIAAYAVAPVLAATGFRFSKEYRWGTTAAKRAVYRLLDTVAANHIANAVRPL
jgi:hypothetical protein